MPSDSPQTTIERALRTACAELDRRVRAGEPIRAEEILEAHLLLTQDEQNAVEVIYTEFVAREESGQQPEPEAYLRRFPRWRQALEDQFRVHAALRATGFGASPDAIASTETPDAVGEYALLERVAQGGTAVIHRARHRILGHEAAVKTLRAGLHDEAARQKIVHEASAIANLRHPHVIHLYESGAAADGRPYITLEWVEGGSLSERLRDRLLPPRDAAHLIAQLARAVQHCHERDIVHGDLTPRNILFRDDGTPAVTDFGFARRMNDPENREASASLQATPAYAAPEQLTGDEPTGPRADVYALGAILYELLCGRPPFLAETPMETVHLVVAQDPEPPHRTGHRLPRDLVTICLRCLQKRPERRYATAAALADDLERFGRGEPIRARPIGPGERLAKWARRRPAAAALLALSVLVPAAAVISATGYLVNRPPPKREPKNPAPTRCATSSSGSWKQRADRTTPCNWPRSTTCGSAIPNGRASF